MLTCWHIWNWWNEAVFEEGFQRPTKPTYVIQNFVRTTIESTNTHVYSSHHNRDTIYIGWKMSQHGWMKFNCDAVCKEHGIWIKGFRLQIGVCDALRVEMWGMYIWLVMALRYGLSHLIVESNSRVLIDMVTSAILRGTPLIWFDAFNSFSDND